MKGLLKPTSNQSGFAGILMTVGISFAIVSILSTVYIYLVNRGKYQGRIREARQMTNVMDSMAQVIKHGYDTWQGSGGACPAPTAQVTINGTNFCFSGTFDNVPATCVGVNYNGITYCAARLNPAAGSPLAFNENLEKHNELIAKNSSQSQFKSYWAKWQSRMDKFYMDDVQKELDVAVMNLRPLINMNSANGSAPFDQAHAQVGPPAGGDPCAVVGSPSCEAASCSPQNRTTNCMSFFNPTQFAANVNAVDCSTEPAGSANYRANCEACDREPGFGGVSACFNLVTCSRNEVDCVGNQRLFFAQTIKLIRSQ